MTASQSTTLIMSQEFNQLLSDTVWTSKTFYRTSSIFFSENYRFCVSAEKKRVNQKDPSVHAASQCLCVCVCVPPRNELPGELIFWALLSSCLPIFPHTFADLLILTRLAFLHHRCLVDFICGPAAPRPKATHTCTLADSYFLTYFPSVWSLHSCIWDFGPWCYSAEWCHAAEPASGIQTGQTGSQHTYWYMHRPFVIRAG